jgi:anti-sigma regulatory factor (Ser/Thr protein kinase)
MTDRIETFGGNTDLLQQLNAAQVRYLIVGGVAVKFYAPERQIDDLDILLDKRADNVARFAHALSPHYIIPVEHFTQSAKSQMPLKHYHYADIVTA